MDFDDFELDPSQLSLDNEMDPFDYEKLKILSKIDETLDTTKSSIRYHEKNEVQNLVNILVNNITLLVALNDAEEKFKNDEISESEIDRIIKQVYAQTNQITSENISAILPDFDESGNGDSTDANIEGEVDF